MLDQLVINVVLHEIIRLISASVNNQSQWYISRILTTANEYIMETNVFQGMFHSNYKKKVNIS
jgi:hypothetical protein